MPNTSVIPPDLRAACDTILRSTFKLPPAAVAYTKALVNGTVAGDCRAYGVPFAKGARTQCLYIISNLSAWRDPQARGVRLIINRYSKPEAWEPQAAA